MVCKHFYSASLVLLPKQISIFKGRERAFGLQSKYRNLWPNILYTMHEGRSKRERDRYTKRERERQRQTDRYTERERERHKEVRWDEGSEGKWRTNGPLYILLFRER